MVCVASRARCLSSQLSIAESRGGVQLGLRRMPEDLAKALAKKSQNALLLELEEVMHEVALARTQVI